MATDIRMKEDLPELTDSIVATYTECRHINHLGHKPLPSREAIYDILDDLMDIIYPGFVRRQNLHMGNVEYHVGDLVDGLHDKLTLQISRVLCHDCPDPDTHRVDFEGIAQQKAIEFLKKLPGLRQILELDAMAAFVGDPAAKNHHEIIFCYPGLEAITIYRIAHELLKLEVPLIPRMMTEHAHFKTGIDIHPGANIGPSFFIDHGTGVVIGETCEIGKHVKLYQGVTLGALSFPRDADGNIIRGEKRHPTLQDEVVVYANATILGGKTTIGHNAVIGSSVWLTQSVDPYTAVVLEKPQLRYKGPGSKKSQDYQI